MYQACAPLKPHLTYRYLYTSTGKPVDEPSHVDYVPSVFAYKPSLAEAVIRQKIERQERAGRRRQLAQEQAVEAQRRTTAAEALINETCSPWLGVLPQHSSPLPPFTAAARSAAYTGIVGVLPASGAESCKGESPSMSAPSLNRAMREVFILAITCMLTNHRFKIRYSLVKAFQYKWIFFALGQCSLGFVHAPYLVA